MARLSDALKDLFGLTISAGALINVRDAARPAFAAETELIRQRLFAGAALASDERACAWARPIGGFGCSITATAPPSWPRPAAPRRSSRRSWANGDPACGLSDRLGSQIGWLGASASSASPISFATSNMASKSGDGVFAPGLKGLFKRARALGRRREELADSALRAYLADLERRIDRLLGLTPVHPAGRKLQQTITAVRGNLFA